MEIQHPPPPLPSISNLPSLTSPRFTPIAIAPKPSSSVNTPSTSLPLPSTTTPIIPQTPARELWTEPEKYDLLWSIILSAGLTATTIPWNKINLPRNHTRPSAQVVIQDIALGKHHITHPTFTPSNKAGVVMVASRDLQSINSNNNNNNNDNNSKRSESGLRGNSSGGGGKKRKLDDGENEPDVGGKEVKKEEEDRYIASKDFEDTHPSSSSSSSLSPPHSSVSSPSSPTSNPDHQPPATKTTKPKLTSRRRKSTSPPINLDLSNPRITSYLKSSGYMNEDGTPVKKRRGRPTKDPFGLSVTLKKQLMRMDPNAPPMKKRGRPRKRFLDIRGGGNNYGGSGMGRDDGSISPGLREAIEKIGEEMVEELLVQGRSMRDTEDEGDDDDDESEGYDGEVAEAWEGDETDDDVGEKEAEELVVENKPESMVLDEGSSMVKTEGSVTGKGEGVPIRQVEKMAVDNLVEKPKADAIRFKS